MEVLDRLRKLADKIGEKDLILHIALEQAGNGFWDWHIQEDYEYMSPGFWQMFGYDKIEDNIPDHPSAWQNIIHPDDLKVALNNFNKHVETKGKHPYNQKVRYKHKNGQWIWVICKGRVIQWNSAGEPLRMIGVHTEIPSE